MTCSTCGATTPRLTLRQTRCPACQSAVDRQLAALAKRLTPRFPAARDTTGMVLGR